MSQLLSYAICSNQIIYRKKRKILPSICNIWWYCQTKMFLKRCPAPIPSLALLPPLLTFTLSGCQSWSDFACSCGVGGWQALFDYFGSLGIVKLDVMPVSTGATWNIIPMLFKWDLAPQRTLRTQSQTNKILCDLCDLCGELNNEKHPLIFLRLSCCPFRLHSDWVPVLIWFRLPLWCGGLAGAFRFFRRYEGVAMYSCPCHHCPNGQPSGSQPCGFVL